MKNTISKLIPVLTDKEKEGIMAYYTCYEKYAGEFSEKAKEDLKDHPVFGKLIGSGGYDDGGCKPTIRIYSQCLQNISQS